MNKEERERYVRQLCKDKGYDEVKTAKAVAAAHRQAEAEDGEILDDILSLPIKGTADYNSKVDELKTYRQTLEKRTNDWQKQAQGVLDAEKQRADRLLKENERFKAKFGDDAIDDDDAAPPRKTKSKGLDDEELRKRLDKRDVENLNLIADTDDVIRSHFKMFGELISRRELLEEVGKAASENRAITVQEAYEAKYGDQVAAKQAELQKAADDKLRAEGAKAERDRLQRAGMRTGAAISEAEGIAFAALNSEGKSDDPNRKLTEDDRIALLTQDLRTEMDKLAQAEA